MEAERYGRTPKGQEEISQSKKTLPAKLRTVLFLIEADKDIRDIERKITLLGAPPDALMQLVNGGYVAPVTAFNAPITASTQSIEEQIRQFRVAKAFMNETVVDALGIRAFMFTLKLERCSTLADLVEMLPDYAKAIAKGRSETETRLLVDRAAELLA